MVPTNLHAIAVSFSLVILTYNRQTHLRHLLGSLATLIEAGLEVIVVDNASCEPASNLNKEFRSVRFVSLEKNIGIEGRNIGIKEATREYVITLDDDVYGITKDDLCKLGELFLIPSLAAVCFKVIHEETREIIDWCHPRLVEDFSDKRFETNDISEGAVAFKKAAFMDAGMYPSYFFISHEGPDIACRLINNGLSVCYEPSIVVKHSRSTLGRASWRRYYFDTRNLLWLVLRNYPFAYGLKRLCLGWGAMLIYSLRDGYFKYWLKAVLKSLSGARRAYVDRISLNTCLNTKLREIEKNKPSLFYLFKKRVFKRSVSI